ncbi:hypothetical protein [Nevskia sp.]|uniref:hypothetical protein n=1 Tax=Nevskia sp. TaxID=1929292 RepID=UPI0025E58603|nr:hypothetical protein [Nevskia sp.]
MNDRPCGSVGGFFCICERFVWRLVRGIDAFADFHQSPANPASRIESIYEIAALKRLKKSGVQARSEIDNSIQLKHLPSCCAAIPAAWHNRCNRA